MKKKIIARSGLLVVLLFTNMLLFCEAIYADNQTIQLYVSTKGNDYWTGSLPEPNANGTDGPFATINKAVSAISQLKKSGKLSLPVTVFLRGGSYYLKEPITFKPEDSAPITFCAYPGEQPIIDGGKLISGWKAQQLNGQTVWTAELSGYKYFRQLFVNGQRRQRARLPKVDINNARNGHPEKFYRMANVPGITMSADWTEGTNSFIAAPGDIKPWKYITDIEIVALHYWIEERMPIVSFNPKSNLVTSSVRSMFWLKDDISDQWAKYYIDNVFEALTEPGEWYLERVGIEGNMRVYYIPMAGETLANLEAFAPQIEQFLILNGNPDKNQFVEYLKFENLIFQHSDWVQPANYKFGNEATGMNENLKYAASAQGASNVPGSIQLEGARYCAIENCKIQHIGYYAVALADGCKGIRIIGNEMYDLGAGGITLNGADYSGEINRRTCNNRITDNHIYSGGKVFHSGIGILSRNSAENLIAHNHIHDLFYSGISVGWVWGFDENISRQNIIEKNQIHDIGHGWLSDMGGVYLLGQQPGTTVRNNLIYNIEKANYGGWALYTDEGSTSIVLENNVCYNTDAQLFHQHYGHENIIRNNIFAFGGLSGIALSRFDGTQAFTFERNIVITDDKPIIVGGYGNDWKGIPYPEIVSDLNLYWNVSKKPISISCQAMDVPQTKPLLSIDEWRKMGFDTHSLIADPKMKSLDLKNFNWTLAEDSPAFGLGFKQIDLSDIGPRPKEKRD